MWCRGEQINIKLILCVLDWHSICHCLVFVIQEVVNFLVEFKAVELLSGVIANSRAPRATVIIAIIILVRIYKCT